MEYTLKKLVLYSHEQLYIHIYIQKHNDAITTSGHSSLEKYTSHFIERVVCERWVGDWTKTATYWPSPTLLAITDFLSCSPWLLNRGPGDLGAQPLLGHGSHSSIFPPTDLNFLSPGLYKNFTSTYFLWASQFALNSTPWQSRSPLISWYLRPDSPVIYTGAFLILIAWPDRRSICNTRQKYLLCWDS